jgi:hypothetical protein
MTTTVIRIPVRSKGVVVVCCPRIRLSLYLSVHYRCFSIGTAILSIAMVKLSVSWALALARLSIVGSLLVQITIAKTDETCSATDGTCSASASAALQCGIYMAPSTLGEETNMGIYTGVPRAKDDVVVKEIAVPLLFREWADHPSGYTDGDLWHRYIWEGPVMDIESYTETDRSDSRAVFVPGVGCTINGTLYMFSSYFYSYTYHSVET